MRSLQIGRSGWLLGIALLACALLISGCAPDVVRYNNAGNEHYDAEAYDDALEAYRRAQVAEPDQPEPYYNAANTYNRRGEADGVLAQAQQALKNASPELSAKTWYNLGNAYFDAHQLQNAAEAYKEALRLQPDDPDAKYNLELTLNQIQSQQSGEGEQSEEQQEEQQPSETPEPEDSPASATPPPELDPNGQEEMTPEQAQQLLEGLLDDPDTLQERLNEMFVAPGEPPEEDW